MKPKKFFSCICVLAVCVSVLFVSACRHDPEPLVEGTYLWENVLITQEMPFSNVKLNLAEIDKEAFDEAEGVNVGCADLTERESTEQEPTEQPSAQVLTYFSFELYVFAEEENDYVQIDVVNFKQVEGSWWYQIDTVDPSKSYGITDMEFYSVSNAPTNPIPFSWLSLKFHIENDSGGAQEANQAWIDYNLRPSSDPLEKGTYYWEIIVENQEAPFSNVKLVLAEIDKEAFEQADGVNVILDESPSATRKYYSFELYVFVEEVNDFIPIDIVGFKNAEATPVYFCQTVNPSGSNGIMEIDLTVTNGFSVFYSIWLGISCKNELNEEVNSKSYTYQLRLLESEGENL